MDIQAYIKSGKLELYLLGELSERERAEVVSMAAKFPEIQSELDELEQLNIEKAIEWTISTRLKTERILTEKFVKELHKKMYGDVWKWAGEFRKSDKNIGVQWAQIRVELKNTLDDAYIGLIIILIHQKKLQFDLSIESFQFTAFLMEMADIQNRSCTQ